MTSIFNIITASHNNLQYLDTWMESILIQDYRPIRVSFVDDCSTDGTYENFKKFGQKLANSDIQVEFIRNSARKFYGSCLKTAFENCKGEFFGCLDSDDALLPGSISAVMKQYIKNPEIGYIYTQFVSCNNDMQNCRRGFSSIPPTGSNLLAEGRKNRHCYSHFRTFSKRIQNIDKIWGVGMRCAVDKFMGYRMEELAKGMFLDRECYMWRTGRKGSISQTEPSRATWNRVMLDAKKRRSIWKIDPFPIIYSKDE